MTGRIEVPEGFVVRRRQRVTLVVSAGLEEGVIDAGLDRPESWRGLLDRPAAGAGRGAVARLNLRGGTGLVLKEMRRGGLAGPLWQGRYVGTRRLLDNLRLPSAAAARGIPTAAPVALLLVPGPPGLFRGWLAVETIEDTRDLADLLVAGTQSVMPALGPAMRLVREMHEYGVEHRDLNLGNLLVRESVPGTFEAFVIDLDRARIHRGPLPFRLRQRALRRLERSWVKQTGGTQIASPGLDALYRLYAGDDQEMARRFERGRATGRRWVRLHRLGRGRSGPGSRRSDR